MKNLGVIVTIALALASGLVGYGAVQARQEGIRAEIDKVDEELQHRDDLIRAELDKHEEEIDSIENFSIKQSMLIENTMKIMEKLENKINDTP